MPTGPSALAPNVTAKDNDGGSSSNELPISPQASTSAQSSSFADHLLPSDAAIGASDPSATVLYSTANPLQVAAAQLPWHAEEEYSHGVGQASRTNATNTTAMARKIARRLSGGSS